MGAGDGPLLVVVTGPPASGKTSVAEELASRLGVAFLSKDTFKEVLYEHLGSGTSSSRPSTLRRSQPSCVWPPRSSRRGWPSSSKATSTPDTILAL